MNHAVIVFHDENRSTSRFFLELSYLFRECG